MRTHRIVGALACALGMARLAAALPVADFEDLTLAPNSFWSGMDTIGPKSFSSHGVAFRNVSYDWGGGFTSWEGFAYSNVNNTTTPGYTNQYAVWTPGVGFGGGGIYAVAYRGAERPRLTLPDPAIVESLRVNNTTYAALSMRDGDAFAKKFGGADGNDPDWFRLTIHGIAENGAATGLVEFYLADFRFSDNSQDYILGEWALVDLTSLGTVKHLEFDLSSSDVGAWGMNTPAYFALDQVAVIPEPAAISLWLIGASAVAAARRRAARRV